LAEIESERFISVRGSNAYPSEHASRECSGQKPFISPEYNNHPHNQLESLIEEENISENDTSKRIMSPPRMQQLDFNQLTLSPGNLINDHPSSYNSSLVCQVKAIDVYRMIKSEASSSIIESGIGNSFEQHNHHYQSSIIHTPEKHPLILQQQ
jgi:hypothetical protein